MSMQSVHRLYTEKKNQAAIVRLIGNEFESFTLQPVTGYYRGKPEQAIVIEIVGASVSAVRRIADQIKKMNGQKSILTIRFRADAETVRW
jgi:hypothetical protein